MSVVRWERFHQEMLIEKVRDRTCLWDIRHPDYRNTHKKQALYDEIALELDQIRPGTSVDDVRKRWANLRCQFSENIRSARGKPGEPIPDRPRKLWCKEILMFLNDVTVPRSSKHRRQQQNHDNGVPPEITQMSSDLEDHEVEDEDNSRHEGGEFSQCGSNCEGGTVSPESCCFTPGRNSVVPGMNVVIDPTKRKPDCLDQITSPGNNIVCTATIPNQLPPLRPQDAIDKYALCVASELRQIRQPQQLVLAKWHIQNVLFQAQFGMLAGPPPPMAFTGQTVSSPYGQETIVTNWQQSPPIQGMPTENDSKEGNPQNQQAQQQHRPPASQQDYVRSLTSV